MTTDGSIQDPMNEAPGNTLPGISMKANTKTCLWISSCLLFGLLIIAVGILAWVPPVSRDALVHHLAVPKLWLQHGGMVEIPELVFSYYPMNVDLLYAIPLYWGNDIAPKFIHFTFGLATSGLIFMYLKRRLNRIYASLGAITFLSTPIIVKLCISAYVDLGLVFFASAGLMCVLRWHENTARPTYLILASLCCGLALGTKYNGLIVLLFMTFLVVFVSTRSNSKRNTSHTAAIWSGLIFCLLAILIYSPWGIRNYIWTGNPLYPLFNTWFNPAATQDSQTLLPLVFRKLSYHETWWQIVLVPLRIFFQGQDDSPQFFDGQLNPALLILPVVFLVSSAWGPSSTKRQFETGVWAFFASFVILIVFFQSHMRIRYIAPAIPGLVILSIFGLEYLLALFARWLPANNTVLLKILTPMIVVLMLSVNTVYVLNQFRIVRPFDYQSGHMTRDQYIEKFRPEYAVIQHANQYLSGDASILSLFIGKRGYYSNRKMRFDQEMFASAIHGSNSQDDLRRKFVEHGLTHLLVRYDLLGNWSNQNLDEKQKQIVISFLNNRDLLLLAKNGHGLYKL